MRAHGRHRDSNAATATSCTLPSMRQRRPTDVRARRELRELYRRADAITARILYGDEPWIDIRIAIASLREEVERRHPDRAWLFEALYEARWDRLREQGWAHARSQ